MRSHDAERLKGATTDTELIVIDPVTTPPVPRQTSCTFFVLKIFPLFEVLFLAPFDWVNGGG